MRKTILILLSALQNVFIARAYEFEVDGIYYNRISGTNQVEVTFYHHEFDIEPYYSGRMIIPASVQYNGATYRVTSIGEYTFKNCRGLTSVTIPNSVTSIGEYAFAFCSGLTSVTIPNSVTSIGEYAFVFCSGLTFVTIPNSVTSIGKGAFYGTSIRSPLYNSNVFAYMPQSYSGEYVIPFGIQTIAGGAFEDCGSLTSVRIPESVTYIGSSAFSRCSGLKSVTIPESVTAIGDAAFFGTSIRSPLYNSKVFALLPKKYSGAYAIPSGIQSIAGDAFYECRDLTSVMIPNSVTTIGEAAFEGCTGLRWVTIPESVIEIGEDAFDGCVSISIPLYNRKIFAYLPQNYRGEYVIPAGIQSIAPTAFSNCEGLTSVTIPNSVTTIGDAAFEGCMGLKWVTISEGVTSIGEAAFSDCEGLTSVMIPNSVTTIGNDAFSGCMGLRWVTISEGVTSIGEAAFSDCEGLTSVTIPESVTSIGDAAFSGCTSISSPLYNSKVFAYMPQDYSGVYAIPSGIQSIAGGAFSGCEGLTSVTIPESVTSIEEGAFFHCSSLTSVTSLSKVPPYCVPEGAFLCLYQILYVPRGCKSAYESAPEWHKFYKILEI